MCASKNCELFEIPFLSNWHKGNSGHEPRVWSPNHWQARRLNKNNFMPSPRQDRCFAVCILHQSHSQLMMHCSCRSMLCDITTTEKVLSCRFERELNPMANFAPLGWRALLKNGSINNIGRLPSNRKSCFDSPSPVASTWTAFATPIDQSRIQGNRFCRTSIQAIKQNGLVGVVFKIGLLVFGQLVLTKASWTSTSTLLASSNPHEQISWSKEFAPWNMRLKSLAPDASQFERSSWLKLLKENMDLKDSTEETVQKKV